MRNRLISTVGTSLFSNIKQTNEPDYQALKAFYAEKNWGQLARELLRLDPTARLCGAEINSIEDAVRRGRIALEHLHFFVSDTEDGRNTGRLLETYFIERGIAGLRTVNYTVVEGLQDESPARFKTHGLRELVREMASLVRQHTASALAIDATGGYKAQIAVAVVFGQALEIPVLYRHERFSEIIDIPPLPVAFNYELLGRNAALLAQFERGAALSHDEIEDLDERIRVLLTEIDVDGVSLFELGAVGQIFLEGFRLRFPKARELPPIAASQKQPPSFRDDHYPSGFKDFVEKVCREVPWIKAAHSLPYDKQKQIKGIGFSVREGKLIGTYQDKDKFGARFEILTDAATGDQLTWAADQLNQQYQD